MKDKVNKISSREIVFMFAGLIIGIIIMSILWPKRIAKLANGQEAVVEYNSGEISADDLYNSMKKRYSSGSIIELIDKAILLPKYGISSEDEETVKEKANYYFETYKNNYQMDKETFLSNNGFKDEEDFIEYLKLDMLRSKYYNDYLLSLVKDESVSEYYNNYYFAPFSVEHILVSTSNLTDEEALKKSTDILNDINNGLSFEEAVNKYKSDIVNEKFEVTFASNLEQTFYNAALELADGQISQIVKTSYGYHIIHRINTTEKKTLDEAFDEIKNALASEYKSDEKYTIQKVLVKMREDNKVKILDTEIKKDYEDYNKSLEKSNNS